MSLIQEALKKREQELSGTKTQPATEPPAKPSTTVAAVTPAAPEAHGMRWVVVGMLAVGLLLVVTAGTLFVVVRGLSPVESPSLAPAPAPPVSVTTVVSSAPEPSPVVDASEPDEPAFFEEDPVVSPPVEAPAELVELPEILPEPEPELEPQSLPEVLPEPVEPPLEPEPEPVVVPNPDAWPSLQLMGTIIVADPMQCSALINGHMVFMMEQYKGVRVLRVDREGAELEYKGRKRYVRKGQKLDNVDYE